MEEERSGKTFCVLDEHPIVVRGVSELLNSQPGWNVAAQLGCAKALFDWLEGHRADLLVMDLSIESVDGIDLIKSIRAIRRGMHIVIFSMLDEAIYSDRVIRAGASAYVMKQWEPSFLVKSIQAVLQPSFDRKSTSRRHPHRACFKDVLDVHELTDREFVVFNLVGMGASTKGIADQLGVSVKTVEAHRENIKRKLAISSYEKLIAAAAGWLARRGSRHAGRVANV